MGQLEKRQWSERNPERMGCLFSCPARDPEPDKIAFPHLPHTHIHIHARIVVYKKKSCTGMRGSLLRRSLSPTRAHRRKEERKTNNGTEVMLVLHFSASRVCWTASLPPLSFLAEFVGPVRPSRQGGGRGGKNEVTGCM